MSRTCTWLKAIGLDETAAKRGHTYVTVFDLDAKNKPVAFATPGAPERHAGASIIRFT